ncbi:dipeptide ABC transporter ATP-binding protein [Cellulosimicrobium cellulans]|uniref:dipeptide ABC transporter ATP-binding protein n=1 Tax=Cellulosimicrobium cellulans TaxID=1710 RepID=UPI0024051E36|nr:ABC transporter ATP-binding protein [Cellulosimicrobium cellulans]MDF9875221.1 peptide/nickel transport system ATP-binding protein [Cellulosimicrobium cellulans]
MTATTPTTQERPGPTSGEAPALEIRGLEVAYRTRDGGSYAAVRGVDLTVGAGEVVALVGESGSGKSTTAHAALHLLARGGEVTAGTIRLGGRDVGRLSEKEWQQVRGRDVGLVPQDPTVSLNPVTRVGDQVAEVLVIHGLARRKEARERAVELLRQAGIDDPEARARQYPSQLSGGMRQRVLIAIAVAARPRLVVADEPTSALDVTVQRRILDHLDGLVRDLGTAVLLITHDLGIAADRADRIVVLERGVVVEEGTADQVLRDPRHPYTRQLIAAAPSLASSRLVAGGTPETAPGDGVVPRAVASRAAVASRVDQRLAVPDGAGPDTAGAPVLTVRDLRKEFTLPRGAVHRTLVAVDGVSLAVGRGETYALVGESGSGKSTTARLALRLERPTAGTVEFAGEDITTARGERLRSLRRGFQVVYQSPYASLDPRFTVEQIVTEPLRAYRVGSPSERADRARALVEDVALPPDVLRRGPRELSGGQRQRVAIARALALNPALVVLDEPVSALDVSVQAQILELLVRLQAEHGLAYLFISHDLAVVRQVSDHVGVMHRGRVVEQGATEQILLDPQQDYTRELVAAIPGLRSARHEIEPQVAR